MNLPAQCRGHGSHPWFGKIPSAAGQLNSRAIEPVLPNKRSHQNEKLVHPNDEKLMHPNDEKLVHPNDEKLVHPNDE